MTIGPWKPSVSEAHKVVNLDREGKIFGDGRMDWIQHGGDIVATLRMDDEEGKSSLRFVGELRVSEPFINTMLHVEIDFYLSEAAAQVIRGCPAAGFDLEAFNADVCRVGRALARTLETSRRLLIGYYERRPYGEECDARKPEGT